MIVTTFADYEAWKAKQQRAAVGAASVVIGAQEQSPDQLAGDLNLASEFGKVTGNPVPPVPMVGEYRSVFQAAIEKKRAETILSSSPRLTEWLRNPENAGVARDDLEGLSWWETGLGATWNATKRRAMLAGPQTYNQYQANVYAERAQDAGRSFGEILRDERTPILNAEGKEVDRVWAGPSDLLGAGYRYAASRLTNLWGQTAEQNAAQYQARAGQIANRIAQIPMSPGGEAGKARFMEAAKAEGWQAQLSAIGKAFTEAPGEMTSFLLQTAAESLPSMAAAAVVGVATRNLGAAAAVMGGTSFAAEYGSAPVEFFKEKGIDVSTPEGAMSVIRNPEIMREAEQRGIIRGVIIGALDGLSGGIAGTKLAESTLGNIVLQSITQAVLGAGGEAGAQVAAGQNFNLAEVVLEGLAEFATAPVEVSGMAVSRVREAQAKARDAEARVGLFQELSGQAVASKLRARMPDRFRQFIEQATANGPVENVFVPAQEFVTYFQSVGVDPYELLGELDGVSRDDLDAALAGGGDLKIPTATYAAKIAGSEHDAFLMQNMRFDPMDMTAREAAEFNARVDEVMAEMWAEAEDVRLEDEKWRAVEAKIYDDMVSRLRMAGRSTEVATTEAMIYPAFYRVMAERSGLSTEEFLERYPLPQVQGAVPQGMQFKNVDDLNRTLAELRSRVKPTTKQTPLLDFIAKRGGIDDVGGELKARNADGQLRPGMGRLARRLTEDGKPMPLTDAEMKSGVRFGWDYTAQAAVEAGFMADNPAVIEWKDAMAKGDRVAPDLTPVLLEEIDRELAGQGGTVDENTAALDEMEEYLSRLGVSLDDSDEAIRAVLEAAQAEDARMYGQPATDLVGDVVPENGLVLLHGSPRPDLSVNDIEIVRDGQKQGKKGRKYGGFYATSVSDAAQANEYANMAGSNGKVYEVVISGGTKVLRKDGDITRLSEGDINRWVSEGYGIVVGKDPRGRTEYVVIDKAAIESVAPEGMASGARMYGQDGQIATESDAFKAWFGDSVVTDADGKPLVVYHGTAADFEAFSKSADAKHIDLPGFFFTPETWIADNFSESASRKPFRDDAGYIAGFENANVIPAYLSIKNPAEINLNDRETGRMSRASDVRAMLEKAQADGHDGAVIRGWSDGSGDVQWVAFSPTQIKSVFNRGTFDPADPRILYQFAGPQSETADIHALATAKDRIAAGANEETVRRETGWFRGPDLKWRYEITDEDARLALMDEPLDDGEELALGDFLRHDRLFAAYPDLAMIPVKVDNSLKAWGQVNGYGSEMILNAARIEAEGGPDALLSTILHEVQHLIQRREGFARGGNAEMSGKVKKALTDLVAARKDRVSKYYIDNRDDFTKADNARRMLQSASMYQDFNRLIDYARMDRPSGVFRHIRNAAQWLHDPVIRSGVHHKEVRELYSRLYVLPKRGPKRNEFLRQYAFDLAQLLRKAAPEGDWQLLADDTRKTASMMKALERESAKASEKLRPYQILKDQARLAEAQSDKAKYASPFEIYQLLAGEVEARNTENRMRMTEAERRDTSPDATMTADRMNGRERISTDDVIVVLQTGEITSPFVANSEPPAPRANGGALDGLLASVRENMARKASLSADLAAAGRPVMFSTADGRRAMAGPDMSKPGGFRLTYLGADGQPSGHSEFATLAEAIRRALDEGMEPSGGRARNYDQRAYHGTPHLFDKFSLSKIGTGEGAQAFGWGLYFAGRKEVAEWYRGKLSSGSFNGTPQEMASYLSRKFNGDNKAAAAELRFDMSYMDYGPNASDALALLESEDFIASPAGRLFQVEIPEDSELLDWDAPLSKQPEGVREKLEALIENYDLMPGKNPTGQSIYEELSQVISPTMADADRMASEALRAAGIPGHRYLDGGSRADGDGSRNYVIYDDSRVEVSSFDQGPRGQISVTADGKSTIRLFESANLSTMLHESGHFFLLVMQDLAAKGETNAAAEYEAVKGWWRENAKAVAADANRARGVQAKGEYRQDGGLKTDSDAFKNWFGASKVVDASGKPLVVYHGTNAEFEAFDPARRGDATGAQSATMGFFFASDPEVASSYADTFNAYKDTKIGRVLTRLFGDMYAVGNEALLRFFKRPSAIVSGGNVMPVYLSIKNPMVFDFKGGEYRERTYADLIEEAKEKGHDGVVLRNTIDEGFNDGGDAVTDVYVAFDPTQIKSVNNRGTFDPADPRILFQRGQPDFTDGDVTVTAEDVIRAIDTGTTGDSVKDMLVDVGMQEQWARAFEAYLMEGKAPSVELRSAFEKFRAWLISVYRRIAGLNVQISDDIRSVFDRMLASDAEIEKAKRTSGDTGNMFASAEQMGLTAEEYDRFLKLRAQAEDEAKARLMGEIMDPIKREQDKAYRAEKEKVRAEVERNINASPVYRAWEWMGNRRWLGDEQPANLPDMRLSKSVLVQRYGEGVLKTLPRGKQTIYAVDGGLDPDDAAGWFGFDSGDQMIRALERAPGRKEAITAETDRVMNERHNDPLTDGEIERRALDAVHNDKRGQWIAAELEAVRKVIGSGVGLTAKEARASARPTIARMTVRDAMAAQRFLAAERKAAGEAARLGAMLARESVWANAARRRISLKAKSALVGGSIDAVARQIDAANNSTLNRNETVQKLIAAKRRQLMNHALYMEARAVADEVGKAERFVRNLNKASTREKIAGAGRRENAQTDYLAALDEILDRYDFRRMSGRAEDRRGALAAFIESMTAAGRENELAIPEAVLRDAGRKPYKTLSVEELRGVIDSLKNIQHVATRWNDLIDGQNQRKLDEAVAEITAAFDENMPKRPPGRVATTGEGVRNSVRQFLDLVLNAGTILREIDGFKDMGAAYRNLKAPIDAAMDRLTVRKEKAAADLEALYAVYSKEERRRMAVREHIPALGYALSKWERIAVALNTGNEGNMQRLTDPRVRGSLTPAQVAAVLSTLDERDARFVQSVWDYVGSFRDDIAVREKRTTGVEPAWVEASPVVIGGMTLRGGYYRLKYDPRLSTLARDDEAQAIGEALQAGRFGKAQTKRGHLEARAKSSGRDVELDMSVLHRHVNEVIYDLELSEPVVNSWRVLQSGGVRQAFMDAGRQADFDALETWLKDVAEGQLAAGDWINKNARRFKSNFTAAKLAFNLGTVAAQITGLSQTMVVVGKRDFLRGLQSSFRAGVADEIAAKSAFMRQRQTTFNKDIADFYNDPKLGPYASRWGDIKREWIGPASFWLMTKVQWFTVDIPTWLAGYQQGLRKYGNDEAKAIAHADAIVKRAQASGLFSDRSAIERGSVSRTTRQNDVVRLFTTLGSYMFAKFNVAYERTMVAGRTVREEGVSVKSAQEAASWALDVAFLFTLEAVAMAALKGKLPDDEDDEDEPGWAKFLAKETAMSVLGTIPFVRDVVSVGSGFEGGGAYGGITAEIAKPFQEIGQGEIDKGFVKSVISGTGLFTGLPSTQINRAVDAGWRAAEGEDVSPLEYLLGKRGK